MTTEPDIEALALRIVRAVKSAFGVGVPGDDPQWITERARQIRGASSLDVVESVDAARVEFVATLFAAETERLRAENARLCDLLRRVDPAWIDGTLMDVIGDIRTELGDDEYAAAD